MPESTPRRGDQRVLVSAIGSLNEGYTKAEALTFLRKRFGWLNALDGINYVNRAEQSIAAGRVASTQVEQGQGAEPVRPPAGSFTAREAVIPVHITPPGQDTYVRQIRVTINEGMTTDDLRKEVEGVIEKWLNRYGNEQTNVSWEVSYVI